MSVAIRVLYDWGRAVVERGHCGRACVALTKPEAAEGVPEIVEVPQPVDRQDEPCLGIELLRDDGRAWVALERLCASPAGSRWDAGRLRVQAARHVLRRHPPHPLGEEVVR